MGSLGKGFWDKSLPYASEGRATGGTERGQFQGTSPTLDRGGSQSRDPAEGPVSWEF